MRWTSVAAVVAALLGLSGCVYGYRAAFVQARYSGESRPDASYYCYDCHGYRFFDPYYDWCSYHGFRYRWADHPRAGLLYRERYVRIREIHPEYGRHRYRPGYRASSRYREAPDYETWRREGGGSRSVQPTIRRRGTEPREPEQERGKTKKRGAGGHQPPSRSGGV